MKGRTIEKNTAGTPLVGTRSHGSAPVRVVRGTAHQMNRSTPSKGMGGMGKKGSSGQKISYGR